MKLEIYKKCFKKTQLEVRILVKSMQGGALKHLPGFHYLYRSKLVSHRTYSSYQKEQIATHQLSVATAVCEYLLVHPVGQSAHHGYCACTITGWVGWLEGS